jgi:phosphoglycerate dehydrogenase-like enzyme
MASREKGGKFRVALTADFYTPDGALRFDDIGLDLLEDQKHIEYTKFADHRPEIEADQIGDANGVIVCTPAVTKRTLLNTEYLLAIGRFGVGYDTVDVHACTDSDVVLFITVGVVNRAVAEATVAWMLALSYRVRIKDSLVREAQWDKRSQYMGQGLRDRTLGVIGLGGIGSELVRLLRGFGMSQPLAYDPYIDADAAVKLGVRLVELDELMSSVDFVSVNCPLTDETRGLIGSHEISLMKPQTYLINTARGGIVDEDALYEALKENRIAGAGIDVFDTEPIVKAPGISELDNILLAPHCIAWTNELFRDIGRADCQGMIDLSRGKQPRGVVNPEVFQKKSFQEKWSRICG